MHIEMLGMFITEHGGMRAKCDARGKVIQRVCLLKSSDIGFQVSFTLVLYCLTTAISTTTTASVVLDN